MTVEVTDLSTLTETQVDAEQALLTALVQEAFPNVDLRGAAGQVVLHLKAILNAAQRQNITNYAQSTSLQAIAANPALADPALVDAVLSNYRLTRQTGAAATGQITLVLDALVPTTIPGGSLFVSGGVTFATAATIAGRIDPSQVVAATDRVLAPLGNGQYALAVPVTAQAAGVGGMLRRGASVVPQFAVAHLVTAYAESDFTGGTAAQTNADLIALLQSGLAAQAWSNRATIDAMLRGQAAFAAILHTSIVGAGDPEMVRDKHSLLPLALFGRSDLYVRTQALPASLALTVTATLVAVTAAGGVWQFSLGRDAAPGFYEVDRIALPSTPQNDAGFALQSDVRSFDASDDGSGFVPDITSAAEAAYSRYQTATIQFLDDQTPTAGLTVNSATASYAVAVSTMPLVSDLQSFAGGRTVRDPAGDVLVKAPVPCFLTVSFNVIKPATAPSPDTAPLAAAVAQTINGLRFPGQVPTALLSGVLQPLLPAGMSLSAIDLFGRIRRPDGTILYVRSDEVLTVPEDPGNMISARTVAFFCDPAAVAITVVASTVPEV